MGPPPKPEVDIEGGIYLFYTPVWMPIDLKLVKQIMTTDFEYFNSHGFFHHEKDWLSMNIFNVYGQKWRDVRNKLTPTFTSGKMKNMYDTLNSLGDRLETKIADYCKRGEPIEMKEITARFATDVGATCLFGLECNSLDEPDNEFRRHGKMIFQPRPFRFFLETVCSWNLLANLGYKFSPKKVTQFLEKVARDAIEFREKNNVSRKDYLDLLIRLKNKGRLDGDSNSKEKGTGFLTFKEIVANMVAMWGPGFETTATATAFLMYELAKNQEVQDKVRAEIWKIIKNRPNGELTYEDLGEMKYTDMCISESMRLHTPVPEVPRKCMKTYTIPGTDQVIDEGTMVLVPAWSIHNDADYYPNPTKFNPENFSPENRSTRPEFSFLAFGGGPRLCIGYRFALMQVKLILIKYLRNYKYFLNSKTPRMIKYETIALTLTAKEDILLDITPAN